MRSSENEFRGAGQRGAPDGEPERLVAYVVCINPQCGYSAGFADLRDRHQSVQTVSLSYNYLGHTRFGAVEWRPGEASGSSARKPD